MTMVLLFAAVLALVLINVPIAVALGIVALVAMIVSHGPDALPNLALVTYNGATNFPLLAIPLFILAGAIANASGISQRLIAFASSLFGWIRGGLAHVAIGSSMFFAEISGSAVADVAALGSVLIPGMKDKGYPAPLAAAVMSSAATLAVIIPPSIPMILYAVMAETSVVQLFVAGIVPGVLGGIGLMAMASWFARRYGLPRDAAFSRSRVWATFKDAIWAFLLPVIILGGIFGGVVTATEGAAIAVLAALFVGTVIYRELDLAHLKRAVLEGGVHTAIVMLLVATSALLGTYLTEVQAPQALARAVSGCTNNKWVVLGLLNVLFLLLGMFLHSAAAIILVVPVVMPLVKAVGIDPVHFGLVVTVNLGIGQQTPPVASVLMVASSIAKASVWEVTRVNIGFIGVLLAVLLLVTYVPASGLALVDLSTVEPPTVTSAARHRGDTGDGAVVVQRDGTIATVVLDRPAKLNALTKPMWAALGAAITTLSADDAVRCIVLRGAGERAFSPGNDIAEFETVRANKAQAREYGAVMHATAAALADCRHPIVAQIHGLCVGGGLEIAALCDLRICGHGSRFGAPIKNLGLVMAYAEMAPLIALVGRAVALEILLEGRIFGADEALAKGLVTRVVPDGDVAAEAAAAAARVAEGAPLAARWHKRFARRLADPRPLTEAERDECFDCFDTEDFRLGVRAFLAKTKPGFVGR